MNDKPGDAIEVTPEIAQAISAGCDAFAGFLERLIANDVAEPLEEFNALIEQREPRSTEEL
jgi:hypothetical protein